MSNHPQRRPGRRRIVPAAALVSAAVLPLIVATGFDNAAAPPATTEPADEPLATLLPLAPDSERVDLIQPVFSNSTAIDNPLFPISNLHSAILLGNNEGQPIKVETTLLHDPVTVDVDGQQIEVLASQFMAYEDGRIHELAIDLYAQDDDGNVWYLGEDVYNYEDGVVADTEGTWLAGQNGAPVAMIMPADPQGGETFRPEDVTGYLVEEVTISEVGVTVDGPTGPVDGAIVAEENHTMEGVYEDKWFAPGYGEFFSGVGDSLEGMALAVPTDATPGEVPAELSALSSGAIAVVDAAGADDWDAAASSLDSMTQAWTDYQAGHAVPPMLAVQMDRALDALAGDRIVPAVDDHNAEGTANAAIDVAQAALDLQLQYVPPADIDRERFELWVRQLIVDAGRLEPVPGFVAGDVATLEWVLDRFAHTLDPAVADQIDGLLAELRTAADDEDVAAAASVAPGLLDIVLELG